MIENETAYNSTEEPAMTTNTPPTKSYKKPLIIGGIILVAIIILFVCFQESKFEKVQSECVKIAGVTFGGGDDCFTIDTDHDISIPNAQQRALEAIQYANKELGFNDSLYSKMLRTTALMGRQSEENDKYKVSWTYHPNDGLEVTYEKK